MNGREIRTKIDSLYEERRQIVHPAFFTLNNEILRIDKEIDKLQKKCPHNYAEDGFCIYCDKEKIK